MRSKFLNIIIILLFRPHSCEICGEKFYRRNIKEKHIEKAHKEEKK
jgi:uncharacterized Zn-finger protein